MNKTIGLQLIFYGVLLAGFSYLVHHLAPTLARPTLVTGLAGSVLCLVWGGRAVLGNRGKALAIITLIPIIFVMLSQTVMTWGGGTQEAPNRSTAALIITVLFVLSMAMLMRIAYAGVLFDGATTSPSKDRGAKPPTPAKTTPWTNAGKR